MFPERINDGIRNDIAAQCEQGQKPSKHAKARYLKQIHQRDLLASLPSSVKLMIHRSDRQIDASIIGRYSWVVFRCIARAITILAVCCAIGLQWLALQSIAWTSMIIDYSKSASLCQAITKTLDGAHPCSLCKIVSRGKTAERRSNLQVLVQKIDMICTKRAITLVRPTAYIDYIAGDFTAFKIVESPPVPPPRNSFSA